MAKITPSHCPVCEQELHVTRLQCPNCSTSIEGSFPLGRFSRLSREQLAFLEAFVRCRGKIKDVEELLGISYPTVISRLDDLVGAMGFDDASEDRRAILERVASGKLSPKDAAALLRGKR
jgi:hypothetical protein